jgi:hypothetical protein
MVILYGPAYEDSPTNIEMNTKCRQVLLSKCYQNFQNRHTLYTRSFTLVCNFQHEIQEQSLYNYFTRFIVWLSNGC